MKTLFKTTYLLSLAIIIFWFIRPWIFWLVGLDFANGNSESSYKLISFYVLPTAILLTISKTLISPHTNTEYVNAVLIRITLSVVSVIIVFLSLWLDMCGWYETERHFESVNSNNRIITQEYGCGATDSDPETETRFVQVRPIGNHLIFIQNINENEINLENWRIEK